MKLRNGTELYNKIKNSKYRIIKYNKRNFLPFVIEKKKKFLFWIYWTEKFSYQTLDIAIRNLKEFERLDSISKKEIVYPTIDSLIE